MSPEDTDRGPVMENVVFFTEKFGFYAAEHLNPWGQICVKLITLLSVEKRWEGLNTEGGR